MIKKKPEKAFVLDLKGKRYYYAVGNTKSYIAAHEARARKNKWYVQEERKKFKEKVKRIQRRK